MLLLARQDAAGIIARVGGFSVRSAGYDAVHGRLSGLGLVERWDHDRDTSARCYLSCRWGEVLPFRLASRLDRRFRVTGGVVPLNNFRW